MALMFSKDDCAIIPGRLRFVVKFQAKHAIIVSGMAKPFQGIFILIAVSRSFGLKR